MVFPFLPLTLALVALSAGTEHGPAATMELEPTFSSVVPATVDVPSQTLKEPSES
jgi:hypothetical protein